MKKRLACSSRYIYHPPQTYRLIFYYWWCVQWADVPSLFQNILMREVRGGNKHECWIQHFCICLLYITNCYSQIVYMLILALHTLHYFDINTFINNFYKIHVIEQWLTYYSLSTNRQSRFFDKSQTWKTWHRKALCFQPSLVR